MVTVSDVRLMLHNVTAELLPDDVIQKQIDIASNYIENIRAEDVDSSTLDYAILVTAAYLSYLQYCIRQEAASGAIPTPMLQMLNELRQLRDRYTDIVSRRRVSAYPFVGRASEDEYTGYAH